MIVSTIKKGGGIVSPAFAYFCSRLYFSFAIICLNKVSLEFSLPTYFPAELERGVTILPPIFVPKEKRVWGVATRTKGVKNYPASPFFISALGSQMQKSLASINRDFSAFSLFPKKKKQKKKSGGRCSLSVTETFTALRMLLLLMLIHFLFIFEYFENWLCRRFAVWVIGTRVERKKGRVVG